MLIIGGSGSGKTNTLLSLIKEQDSDSFIDNARLKRTKISVSD